MKHVEVEADHLLLLLKKTHANKEIEMITLIFTTKENLFPIPKLPFSFLEGGGEGRDSSRSLCFCCLVLGFFL